MCMLVLRAPAITAQVREACNPNSPGFAVILKRWVVEGAFFVDRPPHGAVHGL